MHLIDIARKAVEIANLNPEFIYVTPDIHGESCFYADPPTIEGGEPTKGCIFGHAVVDLGVDIHCLVDVNAQASELFSGSYLGVVDTDEAHDNYHLIAAMDEVQRLQDMGKTWGVSVDVLRPFVVGYHRVDTVTRQTQEPDRYYVGWDTNEVSFIFVTPDGVGRYWFDDMQDAVNEHGTTYPVYVVDSPVDPTEI